MASELDELVREIRACRICVDSPSGPPLPHAPRPVLRVSSTARLAICGQAPGTRVHATGVPFSDASGDRLRRWMGIGEAEFYDQRRIAIIPMGFCFPGLDVRGGDLPPRAECAAHWRARLLERLSRIELTLLVGQYAVRWHLPDRRRESLTETVRDWRKVLKSRHEGGQRYLPLPHPSWRNNAWVKANPWFEQELVPRLRQEVRRLIE